MNFKYCKNIDENTYEILLAGEVGKDIIGSEIASEILALNSIGVKVIKERINTIGGTILDAFSIVSANLSSDAEIHTINEGVADSSGSFILASGTLGKRSALDFATMKVHNTSHNGVMLEEMEDSPLKEELLIMRDSIVTILSNNSGKTKDEIKEMMNQGKRMTAKESKACGFIDNIITSKNTPELIENMSLAEMMNVCRDFNNLTKEIDSKNTDKLDNKMETVLNYLNLSPDAKEGSVLEAVQNINKKATESEGEVEILKTELDEIKNQATEKDEKISELESQVSEFKTKEIENAVKSAISSGKFVEDNSEALTEKANLLGIENFNQMIDMVNLPQVNVVDKIKNKGQKLATEDKKEKELSDEYQNLCENDSEELERIMHQEPERYQKMEDAWNKY